VYRGPLGQWAFLLHRVSGIAVALFLYVHILDTALVGFGPQVYNVVTGIYHRPAVRLLEVLLVGAVLYHGVNGIRVIAIDFWPRAIDYNSTMLRVSVIIFPILVLILGYIMLRQVL
jgi:succinate dehydrogenase / fumarate reductase cytochrome b subunit